MRLFGVLLLVLAGGSTAQADYLNQISLDMGVSFRGDGFEQDLHIATTTYSQFNSFFRLPGRRNLHLSRYQGNTGLDGEGPEEDIAMFGLSQDVMIGRGEVYFLAGLGAFIGSDGTDRIGSKFVFRERLGVGVYRGYYNLELAVHHISNGSLQEPNQGENFAVLSLGYRF